MNDEELEQYFSAKADKMIDENPLWYIDRIDFRR